MLTVLFVVFVCRAPQTAPAPRFAFVGRDGVTIVEQGANRRVPGSDGVETFAWDRDGDHLVVTRGARLERLHVASGELELITDRFASVRMPDVSPDGARIVFAATTEPPPAQNWQVVALDRASGAAQVLCDGYDPCFARDGESVYCERYPDRDVWTIELGSKALRRASEQIADRYTVQADPYGRRIAFSSARKLVLRDLDALSERVLSPDGVYDRFASFSPHRQRLLFFREGAAEPGGTFRGIVELDLKTGAERKLVEGDVDFAAYAPVTLSTFVELARVANASLEPASRLPIDAERDPTLHRWLANERQESAAQHLHLPTTDTLSPCEASALSRFDGTAIFLPKLSTLDAASAALLARFKGSLFLDGLRELDVPTATALATWRGNAEQCFLSLDGVRSASNDVLAALATCRGWGLSLDGLTTLSPAAAARLAPLQVAFLDLDGLSDLEPATASAMANWRAKFLSLRGWRSPAPETLALVQRGCAELILR